MENNESDEEDGVSEMTTVTELDWWDAHLVRMRELRTDPTYLAERAAWRKAHPITIDERVDFPSLDADEYNAYDVWSEINHR